MLISSLKYVDPQLPSGDTVLTPLPVFILTCMIGCFNARVVLTLVLKNPKGLSLIKEISPVDLTELMKLTLKANEKQLQKQIDFWQREFRFWK